MMIRFLNSSTMDDEDIHTIVSTIVDIIQVHEPPHKMNYARAELVESLVRLSSTHHRNLSVDTRGCISFLLHLCCQVRFTLPTTSSSSTSFASSFATLRVLYTPSTIRTAIDLFKSCDLSSDYAIGTYSVRLINCLLVPVPPDTSSLALFIGQGLSSHLVGLITSVPTSAKCVRAALREIADAALRHVLPRDSVEEQGRVAKTLARHLSRQHKATAQSPGSVRGNSDGNGGSEKSGGRGLASGQGVIDMLCAEVNADVSVCSQLAMQIEGCRQVFFSSTVFDDAE